MSSNEITKAQGFLDEILKMPYSNTSVIISRESQLEEIVRNSGEEVVPLLGLLQTKIMLGKAEEGIDLAQRIWETGGQITKFQESLFIYHLNALGLYSKALTLIKPKMSLYHSARDEYASLKLAMVRCSIGLGDLDLLSRVIQLEEFDREERHVLETFIKQTEEAGLRQHFAMQQQIIGKVLYGKQTAMEVEYDTSRGFPELEVGIFLGGDSVDRYQIQQQINEAYIEYYTENKTEVLDNFSYSVFDIKEHWNIA